MGNLEWLQQKVLADYESYSGPILERFFRQVYAETGLYNTVTNYWRKKDGKDEIDLIAVNDTEKSIVIGEIKRNPEKIDLHVLEKKAVSIVAHHKKWSVSYIGLSMKDMLP